jgi:L-ascorbate metabolism protein UlaG (beta-lactamase superfamily)
MNVIKIDTFSVNSVKEFVNSEITPSSVIDIAWIGQAGFIIKFNQKIYIIDPYLSDFLSKKYKGKIFPHIRLMKIPINPEEFNKLNYVFCTHTHSDHMDPETVSIFSKNFADCKFIIPAAEIEEAINRGINKRQLIPVNADQTINLDTRVDVSAIAAAHENFKINERWEHSFLCYILHIDGVNIYHSGDCVPYVGLIEKLRTIGIDIALLPINGRDNYRLDHGITGNFKIAEVLDLCEKVNIKHLIVHHFGMFAYNSVSKESLVDLAKLNSDSLQIIIPKINIVYRVKKN